jgi:hypothetical protein
MLLAEYLDLSQQTHREECRKRLRPQLEICGRRKATNFSVIQALYNLARKSQGRIWKKEQLHLSQHVAINDPEPVQALEVAVAKLLPKVEVGENQR